MEAHATEARRPARPCSTGRGPTSRLLASATGSLCDALQRERAREVPKCDAARGRASGGVARKRPRACSSAEAGTKFVRHGPSTAIGGEEPASVRALGRGVRAVIKYRLRKMKHTQNGQPWTQCSDPGGAWATSARARAHAGPMCSPHRPKSSSGKDVGSQPSRSCSVNAAALRDAAASMRSPRQAPHRGCMRRGGGQVP